MRELGYADAQVTVGGADGGIDVHSSAALAQVKWRGGMVGRPELQALFGARGTDFSKQLLFFAASDYSQHAVGYADHSQIALFVYDPIGILAPKNRHAAALLNSGQHNLLGRSSQPGLPLQMSKSKQEFGSQVEPFLKEVAWPFLKNAVWPFLRNAVWPFFKAHWRIVIAIFFTIGIIPGISISVSPEPGLDRGNGVLTLAVCLIGSLIFWWLYLTDHSRTKSEKHISGDDGITPTSPEP